MLHYYKCVPCGWVSAPRYSFEAIPKCLTCGEPTTSYLYKGGVAVPAPDSEIATVNNWDAWKDASPMEEKMSDAVHHPSHYNVGKIEVIEFIEDQKLDHHRGTAVKYICRAGRKNPDTFVEDIQKAVWYLQRLIEIQMPEPRRPNEMNEKRDKKKPDDCEHNELITDGKNPPQCASCGAPIMP